jgi:hypothetical protein
MIKTNSIPQFLSSYVLREIFNEISLNSYFGYMIDEHIENKILHKCIQ